METRSSPSLDTLHSLARQAHIGAQDLSSLSKPALFGHLRSHYDYGRLERAHQIALKRGEVSASATTTTTTTTTGSSSSSSSNHSNGHSAPCSKRPCRTRGGESSSSAAAAGGGSSSSSSQAPSPEEQGLPPASIFVQTRSRSRMLLAGGAAGSAGAPAASARATSSISPRAGARQLKLSGGGSAAPGGKAGGSSSSSGGGGGSTAGTGTAGGASTDTACSGGGGGAEAGKAEAGEAPECAENKAKRKRRGGSGGRASSPGRGGAGKGKGKGKAKGSGGGDGGSEGRGRSCDARGGKSSAGVGGGSGEKEAEGCRPNELDPIMLVAVGKDHYRFVRPNGRIVMYNLDSLVDYFISTGDFLEPETRLPFSDEELLDIDSKVRVAGLSKPSVLQAKRDPSRYTAQKFQQDALVGLERMISELVTGMLRVVEESDREEGEIRLVTEIFPPFADLFKQIWAADKAFAQQCMQHYTSWLQGPPNRPTEDEMGFLDIILGFLKQLQECEGSSSLGF